MRNAVLDESQTGIKFSGEISTTLDMQMMPLFFFFFLNMEHVTNLRIILAQGPC